MVHWKHQRMKIYSSSKAEEAEKADPDKAYSDKAIFLYSTIHTLFKYPFYAVKLGYHEHGKNEHKKLVKLVILLLK